MKKYLCILLLFALLLSAVGCAAPSDEEDVLPPVRIGSSEIQALIEDYTFPSAFSASDVVARIKVGSWLAEDLDLHKSYYKATTLQCFKGDLPDEFTLLQDGCSNGSLKGYPLFTSGNEILVFLKEATGLTGYDSPYWIIGSFSTVMDVSRDDSGAIYYCDRFGKMGETIDISSNYALQSEVFTEVYANSVQADAIAANLYSYPYVFSENDLTSLMESLSHGKTD